MIYRSTTAVDQVFENQEANDETCFNNIANRAFTNKGGWTTSRFAGFQFH
jgi:hypothetical protein